MELLSNINKIAFFLAVKKITIWFFGVLSLCSSEHCHLSHFLDVSSSLVFISRTDDTSCMCAAPQVGWQMSPQALRASCLGQA